MILGLNNNNNNNNNIFILLLLLLLLLCFISVTYCGPGNSSGKALGYGLDGPGSIPGVGGVEIFLRSFVSRLVLRFTQPPIK